MGTRAVERRPMTYRSPEEALRERTAALEAELRQLEERRKSATELEADIDRVVDSLAKSRTLLDRLEKKRALPLLDHVRVASPCDANWDEMVGDDKSRYCGKCEKNVFNLSAMGREEAEVLMLEKDGSLCIRMYRRKDGTVLTQDCPVGVRRKRLRLFGVMAIGGGALATAAGFAAATLTGDGAHELEGKARVHIQVRSRPHLLGAGALELPEPESEPEVEMGKRAPMPAPHVAPQKR